MKPFSFGLEKLLKLRIYREDEAKIELGRAVGVLTDIENRIQAVGHERYKASADQFNPENTMVQIRQYTLYIMKLDYTKEQLLKDAARAELKVEEARAVFLEASRERKVLDKLKEKQQKEYRKEFFNNETKVLDDSFRAGAMEPLLDQ